MTVFEWLAMPTGTTNETVLNRLCFLVNLNHGWLVVRDKTGLRNWPEMLELTGMAGCLDGLIKANDGKDWDVVKQMIEKESKRQIDCENKSVEGLVVGSLPARG